MKNSIKRQEIDVLAEKERNNCFQVKQKANYFILIFIEFSQARIQIQCINTLPLQYKSKHSSLTTCSYGM